MAVVNKRTLVDSGTRHVVMFEINNATNDAVQVIDASALRGHDSNPTLDISAIKWNTTAATSDVAIEFDASTDDGTTTKYITNLNTGVQYRWTGTEWILSWEGEYQKGTWRLAL